MSIHFAPLGMEVWMALLSIFATIVLDSAAAHRAIGTREDFGVALSRLGAVHFSLGTLTTAGTGSLAAISQLAREFVSAQMVTDLLFLA
jgi:hypothetical protein